MADGRPGGGDPRTGPSAGGGGTGPGCRGFDQPSRLVAVTFHTRPALGLGPPVPARLSLRSANELGPGRLGITWHWTGADGTLYRPAPIPRLQGIWRYHVQTLGYGDIAYHGAYDGDGNTYGLRDARYVGAHAGSTDNVANRLTDGIVFLEDVRGWTAAAAEAFTWWQQLWQFVLRRRPVEYAHHWWSEGHGGLPTECPGPYVSTAVQHVGGNV